MPRIAQYQAQVSAQVPGAARAVPAPALGASLANAGAGVLGTLASEGAQYLEREKAQKKQLDGLRFNQKFAEFQNQWMQTQVDSEANVDGSRPDVQRYSKDMPALAQASWQKFMGDMGDLDPDVKAHADVLGTKWIGGVQGRAMAVQAKAVGDFVSTSTNDIIENVANAAMANPNSESARLAYDSGLRAFDTMNFQAEPQRQEAIARLKQSYLYGSAQGAIEASTSVQQLTSLKSSLTAENSSYASSLTPNQFGSLLRAVDVQARSLEADARAARAEQRALSAEARSMVGSVRSRLVNGYDIPASEMQAVNQAVAAAGDQEAAKAMSDLDAVKSDIQSMRKLPIPDLQSAVQALAAETKSDGATNEEIIRLNSAQEILSQRLMQARERPLELTAEMTKQPLTTLDVFSPDSIIRRVALADASKEVVGRATFFANDAEVDAFVKQFDGMSPEQKMSAGLSLKENAPKYWRLAVAQMGKQSPTDAYAVGLSASNPAAALNVWRGIEVLNNDPRRRPKPVTTTAEANSAMGDALAKMPGIATNALLRSAEAYYVANGGDAEVADTDQFKSALRAVVGGDPTDSDTGWLALNNGTTILPPKVKGSEFESWLENTTNDDWRSIAESKGLPRYSDGTVADVAQVREEARMYLVAPGRYLPMVEDAGGNYSALMDADGNQYILNITPETVRGGR